MPASSIAAAGFWPNGATPTHADMTFSVAKSYLALLAGLALGDGLIRSLDDKAGDYAPR